MATSNVCPKCGAVNPPGWTFCSNCGSPAPMSAGMPGTGGPTQAPPIGPPPTYPGYAPYPMPSPFAGERQKQVDRTKTGLLLLLIGGLISWIPFIGILGAILLLIGAILVILGRKAFGAAHSRNVVIAIVLFFVGFIAGAVLAVVFVVSLVGLTGSDPATIANAAANAFNNLLLGAIVVSAISGIASVLFTYALQLKTGRIFLWAGYAANIAIGIAVYAIISAALANAVAQAISGGTYNPAPLAAIQDQINALRLLSAIPALLYAAATYLAWSRVSRGEIPPPAIMPGMPTMGAPPMGPSPPM